MGFMTNQKKNEHNLFEAIGALVNQQEVRAFFLDLCTPAEIQAMAERFHIATLLAGQSLSYREISEITGASTTTIGRVARFLRDENYGGYELVINRLKE